MPENPAAFPREDYQAGIAPGQSGMTLRDYFAGQWLTTIQARVPVSIEHIAQQSYAMADAMLAEREKIKP